ncbi:MAG: WecB/TagA/CpsF family glycosyltransferase [Burkholderiaceae bacterium]
MDTQNIFRISEFPVQSTTQKKLAMHLLDTIAMNNQDALFFVNTNFIVKCRFILDQVDDPSVLLVNDGVGMDIAATLMHRRKFDENLNGTDFTPFLFRQTKTPLRVFMLGGKPEVLAKAARYVRQQLGQNVVGTCDGYDGLKNTQDLIKYINESRAQVVLVAMGNPIQERWILENRDALDANVLMGVGALFDFFAGDKARAPLLVQRLRLEWLYRLYLEPRRLARRYTWDILIFFQYCFKYR